MSTKTEDGKQRRRRWHSESWKKSAVKLAEEKGVAEAADKLGISRESLYAWRRKYSQPKAQPQGDEELSVEELKTLLAQKEQELIQKDAQIKENSQEIQGLRKDLNWMECAVDTLKKSAAILAEDQLGRKRPRS